MRLGTQTASLVNHLQSRAVIGQPEPVIGMGATILGWTDRHPATIIKIDGERITVREDNATRIDSNGMSESQQYEFSPNENGRELTFRRQANGMWRETYFNVATKRWRWCEGSGLRIGERNKYYDFSF